MHNNNFYYKELWELREQNESLTETNQLLKDELINIFDKLTDPEMKRSEIEEIV